MALRGETVNVAVNPQGAKQLEGIERVAPAQIEMRNGMRTEAGNWKMRAGQREAWALAAKDEVTALIASKRDGTKLGFAVTKLGRIFELEHNKVSIEVTGVTLNGRRRPMWAKFDEDVIITDGQAPIKMRAAGTVSEILGGSPPAAKFIGVVSDRVVLAGYNDTGFQWSGQGNAESWPALNFSNVTGHGEKIEFMQVKDLDLYFFKGGAIEIWSHIGGVEVFGRRGIVTVMDKTKSSRGIQGFTVVQARNTFFFYANQDFWMLDGFTPRTISAKYKKEIGKLGTVHDAYGFNFSKEHVIRWFFPSESRTFSYDYVNDVFSEDNAWRHGDWERMRISSYMELDGKSYVGDFEPTGRISEWTEDEQTDNGEPIRMVRRFRVPIGKDGHKGRVNRMRFRLKRGDRTFATRTVLYTVGSNQRRGTGLLLRLEGHAVTNAQRRRAYAGLHVFGAFDETTVDRSGLLTFRWKFDEEAIGQSRDLDMGKLGEYYPYIDVYRLGVGREMEVELVQTDATPHVLTDAMVTIHTLGH